MTINVISTKAIPSSSDVGGSFTCRREHAVVCENICNQLGGGLSTNPDGSITCSFKAPDPSNGASQVPGSFSVKKEEVSIGGVVCDQLGGKFSESNSEAKCEFLLPAERRWSTCQLSNDAGMIRFDTDTFYIVAATSTGVLLKVFQGGREIEETTLTFFRNENGSRVDTKGPDGSTSTLHFVTRDGTLYVRYTYCHREVFELETPLASAEKVFTSQYARHPESHPSLPYLQLFLDEIRRNPPFYEQVMSLIGLTPKPPEPGDVISFCEVACAACLVTLQPHACVVWAFCTGASGFFQAPS